MLAAIDYLTYIGGGATDHVNGIDVGQDGTAYVSIHSWSNDFPVPLEGDDNAERPVGAALSINPDVASDPLWSRYLGGRGRVIPQGVAVVEDSADADLNGVYITGFSGPEEDAYFQAQFPGIYTNYGDNDGSIRLDNADFLVMKLDFSGMPQYITTIGGSDKDRAYAIEVDEEGNAFVAGWTGSEDFPADGDSNTLSLAGKSDALVVKLDSSGKLEYSTVVGGSQSDTASDIELHDGTAYIVGRTHSDEFLQFEGQALNPNKKANAFVAKLTDDTGSPSWSGVTPLGGNGDDFGYGIASDGNSLYVTGSTRSSDDFSQAPVGFQPATSRGDVAFVAKLDLMNLAHERTAFLGGASDDLGTSIALMSDGKVVVAGETKSSDFPVFDAIDDTHNGQEDVFVSILSSDLTELSSSTYIGGSARDDQVSITLGADDSIYVVGATSSNDLLSSNTVNTVGFDQTTSGREGFLFKLTTAPTPGITVSPTSGLLTSEDGATDDFTVVLDTAPIADVMVGISTGDDTEGLVSTAAKGSTPAQGPAPMVTLTFTPSDWDSPQTVTVNGQNDALQDGDLSYTVATAPAVSVDLAYDGINPADVTVTNNDDEPPIGDPNSIYVWDIAFASKNRGRHVDYRILVDVNLDSENLGVADASDEDAQGVNVTVNLTRDSDGAMVGSYSGTTDSSGTFQTGWIKNLSPGTYTAEVVDLVHASYMWDDLLDPTSNDNDEDGDGRPDDAFTVL